MKNLSFHTACVLGVIVMMVGDLAAAEILPRFTFGNPGTNSQGGTRQGFSVALSDRIAAVGSPGDNTAAPGGGVVKVYDLTTGGLFHTLVSPDVDLGDGFGLSVALSGSRLVVAAPWKDAGVTNAGRIYVFDLSGDSPTVPCLIIPNPEPSVDAQFGFSVAFEGSRLIVGAPMLFSVQPNSGKVFAYDLDGEHPRDPKHVLTNPGLAKAGEFGRAVAISGTNVAVGALGGGTGTNDSGVAYVYGLGDLQSPMPYLAIHNPRASSAAGFAISVGISGRTVVVGAPNDSAVSNMAGSVFVFDLDSPAPDVPIGNWSNPNPAEFDHFGVSLAVSGSHVVIGASWDDFGAMDAGAAYVYDLGQISSPDPAWTIPNPTPIGTGFLGDYFGESVAIYGEKILVGSQNDDSEAVDAGSAYLFDLGTANPTLPIAMLSAPSPSSFDRFGSAIGVSGGRVLVGVPADDTAARDSGAAYVYDITSAAPSVPLLQLTNPSAVPYEGFGRATAISGNRVVVGVPNSNAGTIAGAGRAYVYDITGTSPAQPWLALTNPQPAEFDGFGSVIAMSGSRVAVGVPADGAHASQFGSVYVFDLDGTVPTRPVLTLTNPVPVIGGRFGEQVAVSGRLLAVATPRDHSGSVPPRPNPKPPAISSGRVYVYDLDSSTPLIPIHVITNFLPATGYVAQLGPSIALHGSYLAVVGYQRAGDIRVFVYDLNSPSPFSPISVIVHPFLNDVWDVNVSVAIFERRVVLTSFKRNELLRDNRSVFVFDLDLDGRNLGSDVLVTTNSTVLGSYRRSAYGPVAMDGAMIVSANANSSFGASGRGAVDVYLVGPRLKATPTGPDKVSLSWMPASLTGFALERTESLFSPNWTPIQGGAENPTVISITNGAGFFRLRQE
jgi:hypothetical protein